jgi:site-specific DNA recombinase
LKKISTIKAASGFNEYGTRLLKLNVCGYCRVSTDSTLQQNSLDAQIEHYKRYISAIKDWKFAGVYVDEGISGKSKRNRAEFLRMLKDAENKKIDLVITKSISRFARNTADCIETVRLIKSWNVGVYFEKENINTLSAESELMLAILSSVAEEELLSVSQNMKWSVSKRFQQGKVQVCTERFMGYDKDENGSLVINKVQAEIIRRIFDDYIAGQGVAKIAKALEADGIEKTTGGTNWSASTVLGMLKNEKYTGDAVLQKTITTNSITFKRKKNEGETPMYYVKDNHPAIISRVQFDKAQQLIKERSRAKGNTQDIAWKYQQRYMLTSKLECGQCGKTFKHTIHNSKSASRQFYWACGTYIDRGVSACNMKNHKRGYR